MGETFATGSVWLVTGASRGLGAAIVEAAQAAGRRVVAGFRSGDQAREFTDASPSSSLGVVLDMTKSTTLSAAADAAVERFGRIDVLVNNAGSGLLGAVEEVTDDSFRELMDVNLFGAVSLLTAVLPTMRLQGRGLIYQMSSISGFKGMPGLGHYAATKFALEGLSESLALELAPLGIRTVIVEPGPFRTDWIAGAMDGKATQRIDDYAGTAHNQIRKLEALHGRQPGDPKRAAKVLVELEAAEALPLRLPLGAVAVARIREKIASLSAEVARFEATSVSTDYP